MSQKQEHEFMELLLSRGSGIVGVVSVEVFAVSGGLWDRWGSKGWWVWW